MMKFDKKALAQVVHVLSFIVGTMVLWHCLKTEPTVYAALILASVGVISVKVAGIASPEVSGSSNPRVG